MQLQEIAPCSAVLVDTVQKKMSVAVGAEMNYVSTLGTLCIALSPFREETSFEKHCSTMGIKVFEILSQN